MTLTLWDLIDRAPAPRAGGGSVRGGEQPVPAGGPAEGSGPAKWIEPTGRGFPVRVRPDEPVAVPEVSGAEARPPTQRRPDASLPAAVSMEDRYEAVTRLMLRTYGIRVRKWRTSMSGVAWCLTYRDGTVKRLIESPRPRGPMSAAVFLHEIGHHAIGFNVYKPRCLEEYHAWRWSLSAMEANGLNITDQVRYRMHASLWYAVMKARRRGIKSIPAELEPFLERPRRPRKRQVI